MDEQPTSIWKEILANMAFLSLIGFTVLYLYLFGEPYKRGYYCNDESIYYPYKDSTVSSFMLYFVGLAIPISTIILVEKIHFSGSEGILTRTSTAPSGRPFWWKCYLVIYLFILGIAINQLLTDIAKYTIGRLRPHFRQVCNPNVDCRVPENQLVYIENFTCQGSNAKRLKDSRLSFPSGHSSFAVFTAAYLVMYLQRRMLWKDFHMLRLVIQFACISMAWFTALSRISDYKHHWSDVLGGSLLGLFVAISIVKSHLFHIIDFKKVNNRTDVNHEATDWKSRELPAIPDTAHGNNFPMTASAEA